MLWGAIFFTKEKPEIQNIVKETLKIKIVLTTQEKIISESKIRFISIF